MKLDKGFVHGEVQFNIKQIKDFCFVPLKFAELLDQILIDYEPFFEINQTF